MKRLKQEVIRPAIEDLFQDKKTEYQPLKIEKTIVPEAIEIEPVLPDEGIPAVANEPMTVSAAEKEEHTDKSELRKALVLGEILRRKF